MCIFYKVIRKTTTGMFPILHSDYCNEGVNSMNISSTSVLLQDERNGEAVQRRQR